MRDVQLLCLQNIRFFKDGHLIPAPSAGLESAYSLVITFEMQKNDSKFNTVIRSWTDNPVLCPVLQWAQLVHSFGATQTQHAIHKSGLCGLVPRKTWQDRINASIVGALHRKQGSPKRMPRLQAKQDGDALPLLRSSDGNVSHWSNGSYHHAYWQMVEGRIFALHQKANGAVLAACCKTNAHVPVISNNTGDCTTSSFDQGPPAVKPLQQCQDET